MSTSSWAGPVLWGLALGAGLWVLVPPSIPDTPGPGDFSTAAAADLLRRLAAAPHPTGSAENQKIRDLLVGELAALSLQPEVRTDTVLVPWGSGAVRGARVDNILARVPGRDSTGTILLSAHYDSVPTGPGAGDDAAAVSAMVEVARHLVAAPPRNDVLLLLTDAEELGLLGARAFVRDEALLAEIAAVANFEARGGGGPSLLFETSDDNAWLIDDFAAAPHPAGNSMAYEVYRRMPNDTDFSVFRRAGMDGLNFGFIDDFPHYHSAIDTPERLDLRSLQHHGENMLSLARALGERDFSAGKSSGNAVFFQLPGLLVRYPSGLALPLALLAALLSAVRLRRSAVVGSVVGSVVAVVSLAAAGAAGLGLAMALSRLHPGMAAIFHPTLYDALPWRVAVAALSVLVVAGLRAATLRWSDVEGMWSGARLVWAVLAVLCAIEAPGASYLLTWPLLAAAVVPVRSAGPAGAVAVFFAAPVADQLLTALGMTGAPVSAVLYGLAALLMVVERPRGLAAGAAAVLIFAVALGSLPQTPSPEHPSHESLLYISDSDGSSWVASRAAPWSEGILSGAISLQEKGERSLMIRGPVLQAPAPDLGLAGPQWRERSTTQTPQQRWVRGTIRGRRDGSLLTVRIPDTAGLIALSIDGEAVSLSGGPLTISYFAPLRDGVQVEAEIRGTEPLTVSLSETTFALPDTVTRGEDAIPVPWGFGVSDGVIVGVDVAL